MFPTWMRVQGGNIYLGNKRMTPPLIACIGGQLVLPPSPSGSSDEGDLLREEIPHKQLPGLWFHTHTKVDCHHILLHPAKAEFITFVSTILQSAILHAWDIYIWAEDGVVLAQMG